MRAPGPDDPCQVLGLQLFAFTVLLNGEPFLCSPVLLFFPASSPVYADELPPKVPTSQELLHPKQTLLI